jgi:hypothetical protein
MEIEFGKQRRLAKAVGLLPQRINDYIIGRRNASALVAKRLGELTGSDPFIWVLPDSAEARRAAVVAWAGLSPAPISADDAPARGPVAEPEDCRNYGVQGPPAPGADCTEEKTS